MAWLFDGHTTSVTGVGLRLSRAAQHP